MNDEIVARLRAVLHNDRSVELMNHEAADEIERLRRELDEANAENRWVGGGALQQFVEDGNE